MDKAEAELERRHAMRLALVRWAQAYRNLRGARLGLARDALAAGISLTETATLLGMSRQHLHYLLKSKNAGGPRASEPRNLQQPDAGPPVTSKEQT